MSGIVLSSSVRQNLLSLQSTADLLATTQSRLSTGKKVNTALDNPTNFFTAQSLDGRASDISNLLDGIGNGVQVLQAANTGITSLSKLVDTAKSIANQALQTTVGYSTKSNVSATISGATALDLRGTTTFTSATASSNVVYQRHRRRHHRDHRPITLGGTSASLVGVGRVDGDGTAARSPRPYPARHRRRLPHRLSAMRRRGWRRPHRQRQDHHLQGGARLRRPALPAGSGVAGQPRHRRQRQLHRLSRRPPPPSRPRSQTVLRCHRSGQRRRIDDRHHGGRRRCVSQLRPVPPARHRRRHAHPDDRSPVPISASPARPTSSRPWPDHGRVGAGATTRHRGRTTSAAALGTLVEDGSTLNVNGKTITFRNARCLPRRERCHRLGRQRQPRHRRQRQLDRLPAGRRRLPTR